VEGGFSDVRETTAHVSCTFVPPTTKHSRASASPNSGIVVLTMFDNLHYLKALSKLGIDA
jgi:hypothetical protein